jgi:ribosomal RNA assembly protein
MADDAADAGAGGAAAPKNHNK